MEPNSNTYFSGPAHVELDLGVDEAVGSVQHGRMVVLPQVLNGLIKLPTPDCEVGHQVDVVGWKTQVVILLARKKLPHFKKALDSLPSFRKPVCGTKLRGPWGVGIAQR